MPEVTSFPLLPNLKEGELCTMLARVAELLRSHSPDLRTLRKTLREWKVWDKEKTPAFLAFLKVPTDAETFSPGPFLSHYLELADENQRRTLLFHFLREQNPILVKSIFDTLDVEQDGRIQSTNELYRMVTSYVYPGEHVDLPDFQQWVSWMKGIDVLRTIGLRWGLGSVGTTYLDEIRQVDMEELLEDLEEGLPTTWTQIPFAPNTSGDDASPEPGNEEPASPPSPQLEPDLPNEPAVEAPTSSNRASAKKSTTAKAPRKQQAATQPTPLPETPSAAPLKQGKARGISPATPPPAPTLPVEIAPIFVRGGVKTMVPLTEKDALANAEKIKKWWESYGFRAPYRAEDFGVVLKGEDEGARTLTELSIAALFANRPEGSAAASTALSALRQSGALDAWISGSATFEESVTTVGLLSLVGGDARFLDLLPVVIHICAALRAQPRRISDFANDPPEVTVRNLHVEVFGRTSALAPFWVIRESLLADLIDAPIYERVAVVPTRSAREHGYRLGFLDSLYAEGMEDLLAASARLQRFFDADCQYNAPLECLKDHLGCRFRCPFAEGCAYNCREKTAL